MRNTVGDLQKRAWSFYGFAGLEGHAVGEVRYVNGWFADQMTRLDWDVTIDGDDEWTVEVPATDDTEARTISTKQEDGEEDQTAASMQLLELINWDDTNVRAVTTNLFVAGQGNYIRTSKGWRVVSVVERDRKKTLDEASVDVPFLWPHPADPSKPDAPLFGVLDLLDELDWLNRQARTQSRQRALISGIVAVADGFQGPNGTDFWEEWNASLSARMTDPDDMSPVRLSGAHDLVKDGVNWIVPPFDYDDVLDRRALAAIQRLAYGLPIPPEILLGMQAQSRATAFQVEECLAPETRVLTADLRWIQVGDLKDDDELAAFDEYAEAPRHRKWRKSTVESVGRANLPSYEVTLEDGTVFVASENHQWLFRDSKRQSKWVTTKWLHEGFSRPQRKHPITVLRSLKPWDEDKSWEAGYLAGLLDGEGTVVTSKTQGGFRVSYAQRENACARTAETVAAGLGFDYYKTNSMGSSVNGACHQYQLRGKQEAVFRTLGQIRPARLLENFENHGGVDAMGDFHTWPVAVTSIVPVGDREVVTLRTSTGTLVAEGYAHHNSGYRAHIEPPAELVAQVSEDALSIILDAQDIAVTPNPSRLLARKNSVQDVKDAYDRGLVTPIYVREVLGIPEDAAPESDGVPPAGSANQPATDPSNVAADEPVTAAQSGPDLSTLLADIDAHLSSELAGVTVMATDRARQRLGAGARASQQSKQEHPEWKTLTNGQLATHLGTDGLKAAGVDLIGQIAEPIDSAARWWVRRVGEAWTQAATLIPGWMGQGDWVTESTDILDVALAEHILATLDQPEPPPLPAGDIRRVVDAAAGDQ